MRRRRSRRRGGTVERWNGGTVERWNGGTVERWNDRAIELGTVERWSGSGFFCGYSGHIRERRARGGMTVSPSVGNLTVPEKTTSESIFARNAGPTPGTLRKPSRVTNGPR